MKSIKKKPPKEKDIQLVICKYLELKGHFFWRQNTSPIFDTKTGFYRPMPKYSIKGLPDIVLIKDGVFWGLEVKRPGSKPSDDQLFFKKRCEESGAKYHIVHSLDDVTALNL